MEYDEHQIPTREVIIEMVANFMFGGTILNNSHRGEVVEMMVLAALGKHWNHVGLGWHPWDLQYGKGTNRIRIQVKHTAALQLWGKTSSQIITFGWKKNAPRSFEKDNPGESIESEGWFCDIFVFGLHDETDNERVDQADPRQWQFLVIPTCDLSRGTNSMSLAKALATWAPVPWNKLQNEVALQIKRLNMHAKDAP
jgi:hypothetical protein